MNRSTRPQMERNSCFNKGKDTFDKINCGPPVVHTKYSPLLIIGHGRSGTSLLAALCRIYLGIGIGTESQFFIRYFKKLYRYGNLNDDSNVRLLIKDICSERYFQRSHKFAGFEVDQEKIFKDLQDRTYSKVLDMTFMQFAEHLNASRWGDKSPEYIYDLPILKQLFPDAQYIHVVRDGRDVAMSSIKEPVFNVNNIYTAAKRWKNNIKLARDFLEQLPSDKFIEVRYEDLLQEPCDVLSKLVKYMGIKDDGEQVTVNIQKHIFEDIKTKNYYKWKTQLSKSEIQLYEYVAGNMLRLYNYETKTESVKKLNFSKKMFWVLHNQLVYLTNPKIWRENYYKAKFRIRNSMIPLRKIWNQK